LHYFYGVRRDLPSFPTRRSSDLTRHGCATLSSLEQALLGLQQVSMEHRRGLMSWSSSRMLREDRPAKVRRLKTTWAFPQAFQVRISPGAHTRRLTSSGTK